MCRYFGDNNSNSENTFTSTGFTTFRKASNRYQEHDKCGYHKTANLRYINRIAEVESCASQLNSQHKQTVTNNRNYLTLIIEMIMWLCKQGLAFRGHDESVNSKNRKS